MTLLMVRGASQAAPPPPPRESPQWVEIDRRPGDGEQCLVCRKRIFDEEVVEIRFQGRTFHVGAPLMGDFVENPRFYFKRLQARTALFDESALEAPPMAVGWLWFGFYVLIGVIFSAVCGYVAVAKARPPMPWFVAGLLGNIAAFVVLLSVPGGDAPCPAGIPRGLRKVPVTRTPSACVSCGCANHPSAAACSDCGTTLIPQVEAETVRV